jgi:branched-chain amino acid transport system substrate-binding protein
VSWPGAKEFFERYKAKFGKEPTYHAACAYESMRVMAEAATQAGGDREKLRAALADGKWSGIMGDVDFTEYDGFNNQNKHQMLVQQILQAQYETVWPQQFATKKATFPFPGWK